PQGKVSPIQELQLTANGKNIHAIAVNGTFDDCQSLVKQAFNDPQFSQAVHLTSANSINICRLIPQSFYYFHAYAQAKRMGYQKLCFSVPSANFGNLAAGVLAQRMGLPVAHFIAAGNVNNIIPDFLKTGNYLPKASSQTLSNAMDVGNPSNWTRV